VLHARYVSEINTFSNQNTKQSTVEIRRTFIKQTAEPIARSKCLQASFVTARSSAPLIFIGVAGFTLAAFAIGHRVLALLLSARASHKALWLWSWHFSWRTRRRFGVLLWVYPRT